MIKNIIFDLGGVLIDFITEKYLKHIRLNDEEIKSYKKMILGICFTDFEILKNDISNILN